MIKFERYRSKPEDIVGIEITKENIRDISNVIGGGIKEHGDISYLNNGVSDATTVVTKMTLLVPTTDGPLELEIGEILCRPSEGGKYFGMARPDFEAKYEAIGARGFVSDSYIRHSIGRPNDQLH